MVEIFQAWTLGDLFGYGSVDLQSGNSSSADIVYLLKKPSEQLGDAEYDYGFTMTVPVGKKLMEMDHSQIM